MKTSQKTLSAAAALLAATLPLASAAISPSIARCVRSTNPAAEHEFDEAVVAQCLDLLPDDYVDQADIEMCYMTAGCEPDEAADITVKVLAYCVELENDPAALAGEELRKRQRVGGGNGNNDNTDNEDVTIPDETADEPAADETDAADAEPTEDTTPDATPEPTAAAPTPTPETPDATPTDNSNTTPNAAATTPPAATSKGPCVTPSTTTINTCETLPNADVTCSERPVVKDKCREGWLCRTSSDGNTTCMEKQDKLTTGGIVVALAFSAAVVVSVALMTFFCCREKSQQKKLKAKMEAAAIAKASGAGKKRDVSARQPLMPAGGRDDGYGGGQEGQVYNDAAPQGGHPGQPNPFQDPARY